MGPSPSGALDLDFGGIFRGFGGVEWKVLIVEFRELGAYYQWFQACTPRVAPICFGILLRDPRALYKGFTKAILGNNLRGTTLKP